ncbi:MAG: hypothetical protein ACOX1Q_08750 [Eubacteriales bacterium]
MEFRALTLEEGDEFDFLSRRTDGKPKKSSLRTRNGMAICFDENDIRPYGKNGNGCQRYTS